MSSAALSEDGQKILIQTDPYASDLVKALPGAKWQETLNCWVIDLSWPAINAIHAIFGANLQVDYGLNLWTQSYWQTYAGPLSSLRFAQDIDLGEGPGARRLWPLQRVAVAAMVKARGYVLGDDMGGGKTATTLAAMKLAAASYGSEAVFPALVVCPNKVRRTWRQEALGDAEHVPWWPELRLEILPKTTAARRKTFSRLAAGDIDVLVTNWESIAGLSRLEKFGNIEMSEKEKTAGPLNGVQWRTVIADEAHRAKDRRAKQTRALKAITFGTPEMGTSEAYFRWALTGTLIGDNSAEAWSILNFVDRRSWPAYSKFVERYSTSTWNAFGGLEIGGVKPEHRDEFYRSLDPVLIRRLRIQFDPFKPEVLQQTLSVTMSSAQKRGYEDMRKSMLAEMDGGVLVATSSMTKAARLHQLAQACGEMVDKGRCGEQGEELLDLQLKGPSCKVDAMLELIEEAGIQPGGGPGGTPIVFGAPSRQLIGLCEAALIKAKIPYALIAGGMSDANQENSERAFETGQVKVALCVIAAAKEGLNSLNLAPVLVFLQKSWSRIDNEQFTARIGRPGSPTSKVTIIDVVTEGTLEEFDQIEKLSAKTDNFQQVVNDERTLRAMLTFKGEAE